MSSTFRVFTVALVLAGAVSTVLADPNDWVSPSYILQQKDTTDRSRTVDAQNSILSYASSTAKGGPWTVTNSKGVLPPSKDPHDYLSFAPYHWPNCNWCGHSTTHLVNSGSDGNSTDDGSSESGPPDDSDPYPDGGDMDYGGSDTDEEENFADTIGTIDTVDYAGPVNSTSSHTLANSTTTMVRRAPRDIGAKRGMQKIRRAPTNDIHGHPESSANIDSHSPVYTESWSDASTPSSSTESQLATNTPDSAAADALVVTAGRPLSLPTTPPSSILPTSNDGTPTTGHVATGTLAPAFAPAKTKTKQTSCTPSPTRSLAPSATWTTCPYVPHDGRVNPDVRMLNGPAAINYASQSILYNAIAYALQKTSAYSSSATSFIDVFFLDPATKMNPNMNFGQVVRGPGLEGQQGTFTGVLDLRGIVKIINGILVLKAASSPDWTAARDQELTLWMGQYTEWLQNSTLGKMSASRPNNHATFYVSQLIATRVLAGDVQGASDAVQNYFSHQFLDQVAASGEQPFEAVRTRPYHYRCFNLEAMITNAKIGDQLGLNLWAVKSKYGATIQTALDYTMHLNPKFEDVTEILPHVASIAAAYGDPTGKYAAFLKRTMSDYQRKSFWFYDQTGALMSSPAAQNQPAVNIVDGSDSTTGVPPTPSEVPFQCPDVFDLVDKVEIDDGIFVTCGELKPFYEIPKPDGE